MPPSLRGEGMTGSPTGPAHHKPGHRPWRAHTPHPSTRKREHSPPRKSPPWTSWPTRAPASRPSGRSRGRAAREPW